MKNLIKILMDDREPKDAVFRALTAMDDVTIQIRRLPVGDYRVDDYLLFERKTLKDFAISIVDGRFFKQMHRLCRSSLKGVLVLEGTGGDFIKTGIQREALQGALITTSLIMGIPVLRSNGFDETARLLVYAARQLKNVAQGGIQRAGYRPKGKRKRQLYILQGLPQVGPKLAERLLEHFGSVQNAFNADIEALEAVDGVGKETAQKIKEAVGEPEFLYGTGFFAEELNA